MDTAPTRPAIDEAQRNRADERLGAVASALADRYRVVQELGRGGMATVYLAEDLRHHRRVAVKVLHAELGAALGAERFLREIEMTAGLHHPHILPLHDSGEARGGLLYYVMPFIEGESLRQRLARERQLPIDDAIRIACDVAGALDYAHRHGLIHRDVKPENVLLHDGRALVADFGIARAVQRAADKDTLTGTGVAVGTPQYMSPEQAAGERELDARTDIFALGCVVYEMLAGSSPFAAPTAQGVIAKVMGEAPRAVSAERRAVPPHVARAGMKALEKLPADRFGSASQFATALSEPPAAIIDAEPGTAALGVSASGRRAFGLTSRDAVWAGLAVATGVAAYAVAASIGGREPRDGGTVRFTLAIPDSQRLSASPNPLAFSPDGRTIVYSGLAGLGRRALYMRPVDQLTSTRIAGTDGAVGPVFSPDGRWIGFTDGTGSFKRVPFGGGNAGQVSRGDTRYGRRGGVNDVIVIASGRGLVIGPALGGPREPLTIVDSARSEIRHADPFFLPDGETIAFRISIAGESEGSRIGLVSMRERRIDGRGAPYTTLNARGGTPLTYVDGFLVVAHPDGTVTAVPIDFRRREVTGPAVQVLDDVAYARGAIASVANNGSLVYARGGGVGGILTIVDDGGAVVGGHNTPRRYQEPRFSPDGRRVAMTVVSPEAASSDVWVLDLASGGMSPLTVRASASRPAWTPDGKRIAYIRGVAYGGQVWWSPADRSGPGELLYAMPAVQAGDRLRISEVTFSPDSRFAVLRTTAGPPSTNDLWLLPLDSGGERRAIPLAHAPFSQAMPRVSHDGRWLAYVSDESGEYEVYVRPFPGPGEARQISEGGGLEPVWASDGRLIYRLGDSFVAATLALAPASRDRAQDISRVDRKLLFEGQYRGTLPTVGPAWFDIHPDNKRFAVVRGIGDDREIIVVVNWVAELRARLASARRQ